MNTQTIVNAYKQAEAELGYIDILAGGAGRKCGYPASIVARLHRELENGQKLYYHCSERSYNILFPVALLDRANELLAFAVRPTAASRGVIAAAVAAAIKAAETLEDLTAAIRAIPGVEAWIGEPEYSNEVSDNYYCYDDCQYVDYYADFDRAVAAAFYFENACDTRPCLLDPAKGIGVRALGDADERGAGVTAYRVKVCGDEHTHNFDFADLKSEPDLHQICDAFGPEVYVIPYDDV